MRNYFLLIYICFYGCDISMPESQKNYIENLNHPILTLKEEKYIKELEVQGFSDIRIDKPDIGRNILGESEYSISLNCSFLLNYNQDSIVKICDNIIDELYSKIIEDSIIFDCNIFNIDLFLSKSSIKSKKYFTQQHYTKKSLEKWNHFKVMKEKNGKYKRVKI